MSALFWPVEGIFYRAVKPDFLDHVLDPPHTKSAGRYHRPGEPALYMSPELEWSRIAVSGYMREDNEPRLIVPLEVKNAFVLDQRNEETCRILGIDRELSNQPWRPALESGEIPPSWTNSDAVRNAGADGIIDRSRHIPDGWHLNLFRWNIPGGPKVNIVGDPVEVAVKREGPKWS